MTIQELEYFKIICREKSITKAARQLYITPQGLSKTLKNLESELQTTLLTRNTSGVTLTETGQYLCDHLDILLTDYYTLRHGIREITQRQNHEIDLLSAYGILRLVTPDCITAFREKYPHISVHYREYPDKQAEKPPLPSRILKTNPSIWKAANSRFIICLWKNAALPALRPISSLKPADSVSATKWYGQIKASPSLSDSCSTICPAMIRWF